MNIKFYKKNNKAPLTDGTLAHRQPTFNTMSGFDILLKIILIHQQPTHTPNWNIKILKNIIKNL